jgi:hypothetical protein
MEKIDLNKIVAHTLSSFRMFSEEVANPNFIWRLVLSISFCVALTIGVFAYFTYLWATGIEMPMNAATSTREQFALTDVTNTVLLYQHKEEVFSELLLARPSAPDYRKGSGVQVVQPSVSSTTIEIIQPPTAGTSTSTTTPKSSR